MGLDISAAWNHISTSKNNLLIEWENGESLPKWSQVTKLAKFYNVSELLFFSTELLKKNKIIPDYRSGENIKNDEGVKKLINLVMTRQKWLERILKSEGGSRNLLQGSGRDIQSPKELANFIKQKLSINIDEIKEISGEDSARKKALNYLIQKTEDQGVFVGKTISYHKIGVNDMRGLFISNDYCPFIILNRKDALSAQIFSFVHELAHLFRKSDSISNSLEFRKIDGAPNSEEIFCNTVAVELLLPEEDFIKDFYDADDIEELSQIYKVSKIFIFYRLKDLNKIPRSLVDGLEREIKIETERNIQLKKNKDKNKKGGDHTNSMKDSNGKLFNRFIAKSYTENKIGYVEAAKLLRFSPENV